MVQRAPAVWTPPFPDRMLERFAQDMRVVSTPTRVAILTRLSAGSAEVVELAQVPLVRNVSRQSLHEGLQLMMEHGWVVRDRRAERDPWVYAIASQELLRMVRQLSLGLIATDLELRSEAEPLRDALPLSVVETRRLPRYCRRCDRLTGWYHHHRTRPHRPVPPASAPVIPPAAGPPPA